MDENKPCAVQQREQGIIIPECPPRTDIEFHDGPRDYYYYAKAGRENYKATYDCLFPA